MVIVPVDITKTIKQNYIMCSPNVNALTDYLVRLENNVASHIQNKD